MNTSPNEGFRYRFTFGILDDKQITDVALYNMKKTTKKLRKNLERCVDTSGEPDNDSAHDQSDMYELRTCGNTPDCEAVLPLDRPGHYVNIRGERTLVCAKCYEFMGIFGGSGEDDETVYPYENY